LTTPDQETLSSAKMPDIKKIFLLNNVCATVILPAKLARKHGLHKGNHVLIEDTEQGILIKKAKVTV
jgi:hypothetical protein